MRRRHASGIEFRAEGRKLIGPALRYGDVSPTHRERFEPGAFELDGATRWLDVGHDPERVIAYTGGGGLVLTNTRDALMVEAELPRIPLADRALAEVRAGRLCGFSIEFEAKRERQDGGLRVIESAELAGIGVVESPSYPASTVEARGAWKKMAMAPASKRRDWARSTVPTGGGPRDCECAGPVNRIRLMRDTFNDMMERAVEDAIDDVVQAVIGNTGPHNNLGSTATGAVRLAKVKGGMRVTLSEAARDTPAGRSLQAADSVAPAVARPLINHEHELTRFRDVDGVRIYESAFAPVILFKSAPTRQGWNGLEFYDEEPPKKRDRAARTGRRRVWL